MMAELLSLAFNYLPIILIWLFIPLLVIGGSGLALSRPEMPVIIMIAIILSFTASTYGQIEATSPIYSRGSGILHFGFLVHAVWILPFFLFLSNSFNAPVSKVNCNLKPFAIAWLLLFCGHLFWGLVAGVPLVDIISTNGIINVVWAVLFGTSIVLVFRTKASLQLLFKVATVVIILRGLYGVFRWAFLGGDPANVYANIERINVKLTYFDICDSAIAFFLFSFLLLYILRFFSSIKRSTLLWIIVIVGIELVLIAFSYRRTAWGGFLIGLLCVLFLAGRKSLVITLPLTLLSMGVFTVISMQRLADMSRGRSFLETFFYDFGAKNISSAETGRTLQLRWALDSVYENPVFGVGSWGSYKEALALMNRGFDVADIIHSGVVQLLLKTGFVGFAILATMVILLIKFYLLHRSNVSEIAKASLDACMVTLVFLLPDFLVGTPIQGFRNMLLISILIALPYCIVHSYSEKNESN